MFYIYVIRDKGGRNYIGYSGNLRARLAEHKGGRNQSTRGRDWDLVYYEAYRSEIAARDRERILKHDG